MRAWIASFSLLAFPAIVADATRDIPAPFLGDWCTLSGPAEEATGESDIRLSKREITYYQGTGKILASASVRDELALIVQLTIDGRVQLVTHRFELADSGTRLLSLSSNGQLHTRAKCRL